MKLLRLLLGRRSSDRRGVPPAVEAALRAKRARDHLARQQHRERRRERRRDDRSSGPVKPAPTSLPAISFEAPVASKAPFRLEPPPRPGQSRKPATRAVPALAREPRKTAPRAAAVRAVVTGRPLPRLVVPGCTLLAVGLGFALARPLFERLWLPQVPLERVAVLGAAVREPETIARALLASAGSPVDRLPAEVVNALVLADPWIESAESLRLPDGTLLVRVVERRAIARYRNTPGSEIALVDPAGRRFLGAVEDAGELPLVAGPLDSDASLSQSTLEILTELRKHVGLADEPSTLTLHLPGPHGDVSVGDPLAGETGYVLEIGEQGPRALLGQTFLKRRVARLASLLDQRDQLLAGARVIDLRYADRAVLRTEPTSG
jgi:cell division septal protein FtsQ